MQILVMRQQEMKVKKIGLNYQQYYRIRKHRGVFINVKIIPLPNLEEQINAIHINN